MANEKEVEPKEARKLDKPVSLRFTQEITKSYIRFLGEYTIGVVDFHYNSSEMILNITFKNSHCLFDWATEFGMWYNRKLVKNEKAR